MSVSWQDTLRTHELAPQASSAALRGGVTVSGGEGAAGAISCGEGWEYGREASEAGVLGECTEFLREGRVPGEVLLTYIHI
jgi:hypothetical protein